VEFHPAWHRLIGLGVQQGVHCLPWVDERVGAHQARVASHYLLTQVEAGVGCPLTMTFAAVPSLRREPELARQWVPRITSRQYDFGLRPPQDKKGCLMGMAMTEKQGGSDVRANTTGAEKLGDGSYRLQGHKFFCSAPMCDAFLTLAQGPTGLTCFLVPRVLPDGQRNRIHIQRLKEKLGNRSNASSEIEYHGAIAWRVGEEARGVPTIIEMVNHTRLDCVVGTTSLMRAALVQALHHCRGRSAFGRPLLQQPLMQNVLADLTVEWEAAVQLMLRLAQGFDESSKNPAEAAFVRLATAVSKYWVCKRGARFAQEAMECLGGSGYVEESVMPRIYREMPLASIWEGSGNVICLDVLRAVQKTPRTLELFFAEVESTRGGDRRLDQAVHNLKASWQRPEEAEIRARRLVERMALVLQASLLLRRSPSFVAEAFCATRLGDNGLREFGTLPSGAAHQALLDRGWSPTLAQLA
jgi:putative acyl-CoA dehydrogenase